MINSNCGIYVFHFDPVNSSVTGQSNSQQFQQLTREFCIFSTNFSNGVFENIILLVKIIEIFSINQQGEKIMIREVLI